MRNFLTKSEVKEYGAKIKHNKKENSIEIKTNGGDKQQTELWGKLLKRHGNTRNVQNYADCISISIETHKQYEKRRNREQEEYVKKALQSKKYKGTTKEKANAIFQDSPWSIHSAKRMFELVEKYDKNPADLSKKGKQSKQSRITRKNKQNGKKKTKN